ncbi:uncharacterized protein LOC135145401 [Zophobas morio]|uniref:uncharacterized protein LOC135145401 n=1 Tax=Zophobas morio TaxID=2755281 RepID=UPI003083D4AD
MIEGFPEERRCEYLYKQLSATQPLNNLKWENVIPLTDLKKRTFIYDSSESIFRCGTCKSEVVRGECSSCHFKYPQLIDVTNASESILETEESLSEDLETEGDTNEYLQKYI